LFSVAICCSSLFLSLLLHPPASLNAPPYFATWFTFQGVQRFDE